MNRRDFLRGAVSIAAASLVPTWAWTRPHAINLNAFCYHENGGEFRSRNSLRSPLVYNLSKPFVQEIGEQSALIATDGMTCLRVDVGHHERDGDARMRPPIDKLPWTPGLDWRPWPEKQHMLAKDTECPECEGEGFVVMDGMAFNCKSCDGDGNGVFPGIQAFKLGNGAMYVDAVYDGRIRRYLESPEWAPVYSPVTKNMVMAIRFRGGHGMQSLLDEKCSLDRMKRN